MTPRSSAPRYWKDRDGWTSCVAQYGSLGIDALSPYLTDLPDDVRSFVTGPEFRKLMVDSNRAATFKNSLDTLSEAEQVTALFETVVTAETNGQFHVTTPGESRSNISEHGPWAVVIKRLRKSTLEDVLSWLDTISTENTAAERIREAIARHGPYDLRVAERERARSAYPYVAELATSLDARPDPDWWDVDALWFGEDASFETFRDHLINHWTDSGCSQGGVIAKELAAQFSMNPIWDTIEEPYTGYGALHIPHETPPQHLIERFDRLRQQTQSYYCEQGITHKTLYRGVPAEPDQPAALESWTDSRTEAKRYAYGRSPRDSGNMEDRGVVLERDVPVKFIVFSHESVPTDRWYSIAGYKGGPPDSPLREFAVLGGSGVGGSR